MNILAAIKREERKLEKQLGKLNHQLSGVRAAVRNPSKPGTQTDPHHPRRSGAIHGCSTRKRV
jgi:hypothetical protein